MGSPRWSAASRCEPDFIRVCGACEHRLLQLLAGPHLDLADALARDALDLAQVPECHRPVLQAPLHEDVLLALGQPARSSCAWGVLKTEWSCSKRFLNL
jgi:hypothetical protein